MLHRSIRIINSATSEATQLFATLRKNDVIGFFGSAISIWKPSGLPYGAAITKSVAIKLASPPVCDSGRVIQKLITSAAFEHIMEACSDKDKLGDNLANIYANEQPNLVHKCIANMIKKRFFKHIITTNYDPNIEKSCKKQKLNICCVIEQSDLKAINSILPIIFKIHGCARRDKYRKQNNSRTMIYHLGLEAELDSWKQKLLERMLKNRTLFICGYSGLDFEICPQLLEFKIKVIWNCLNIEDLSYNALRLLENKKGTIIIGDMRKVLGELSGTNQIDVKMPANKSYIRNVFNKFSDWDLNLWRTNLFRGIGCAREGIRISKEEMLQKMNLDSDKVYVSLNNLGASYFSSGEYKKAAICQDKAAKIAIINKDIKRYILAQLDKNEAERCGGYWLKATRHIHELSCLPIKDDWINAKIKLNKVLLLREWYRLAKMVRLRPLIRKLQNKSKQHLKAIVNIAAKKGAWQELQQCELWAQRLDINFSDVYAGPLNPLPSRKGYKHMGYFVAENMAIRDDIQKGKLILTKKEILDRLNIAFELGARPELWKLSLLIIQKGGINRISWIPLKKAIQAWLKCEYTIFQRVFLILKS